MSPRRPFTGYSPKAALDFAPQGYDQKRSGDESKMIRNRPGVPMRKNHQPFAFSTPFAGRNQPCNFV